MTTPLKIADLSNEILDLLIAQHQGVDAVLSDVQPSGCRTCVTYYSRDEEDDFLDGRSYCPSEHWEDGGPLANKLITRFQRHTVMDRTVWEAVIEEDGKTSWAFGATMLLAAMRCILMAQHGEMVDAPNTDFSYIE